MIIPWTWLIRTAGIGILITIIFGIADLMSGGDGYGFLQGLILTALVLAIMLAINLITW